MGIKDYLKHLNQEESGNTKRNYEHIYVDCNYMLHYLIYKCKNDLELYSRTFDYFKYIFDTITVSKTINLFFDGNYDKNLLTNPKQQTSELRHKYKKESDEYDKQSIHPGSTIISTFKTYLNDIIDKYKKINISSYQVFTFDDSIDGEADFKILDNIWESTNDNICIISKDSDMILIAYSLIFNKKISIDILINFRPIKFINVNNITFLPKPTFNGKKFIQKFGPDYVLIIMLLGNDYLPKLSNINYQVIIDTYIKYISLGNKRIIKNQQINYKNFLEFITMIIIDKKVKFNIKNLDTDRFNIYYNNLCWSLKQYKILDNDLTYIQDIQNVQNKKNDSESDSETKNKNRIRNVINVYNFINYFI